MTVYLPTPVVEIAFGFGPYDEPDPGDWVDVSEWVHSAEPTRGEEAELVDPSAGTMTVVFDNSARTFDPDHATGPFFGDLVPDVPIRFRATGPDESIFVGFVEGWPITYRDGGIVSEVTVTASDALRVLGEATAADPLAALPEETTGQRIARVLDLAGWPAALRAIDAGEMICAAGVIGDGTFGDYLVLVNATEQGRLFVDRAGLVTFHNRSRFLSAPTEQTSQFDFVAGGPLALEDDSIRLVLDNRYVYDSAVVERDGGVAQAVDSGSTRRTWSVSGTLHATDAQARALADYVVYRYAAPAQIRADAWTVQPELEPTDWAALLALEIGHRVALEFTPGDIGDPIEFELHLAKIAHATTPEQWQMTFFGTPIDPNADSYFTWGGVGATQGWGTGVWR